MSACYRSEALILLDALSGELEKLEKRLENLKKGDLALVLQPYLDAKVEYQQVLVDSPKDIKKVEAAESHVRKTFAALEWARANPTPWEVISGVEMEITIVKELKAKIDYKSNTTSVII